MEDYSKAYRAAKFHEAYEVGYSEKVRMMTLCTAEDYMGLSPEEMRLDFIQKAYRPVD